MYAWKHAANHPASAVPAEIQMLVRIDIISTSILTLCACPTDSAIVIENGNANMNPARQRVQSNKPQPMYGQLLIRDVSNARDATMRVEQIPQQNNSPNLR